MGTGKSHSTQGGGTRESRRVAEWIRLIQEREACAVEITNRRAWSDELYSEGEKYKKGTNGKEVYMMTKWGEGMRKEKVKCKTALTAAPKWTKNEKGQFEQIETADMLMNNYECLVRAIGWVTTNKMNKWLEEENGRIEDTFEAITREQRERTQREQEEAEQWRTDPERKLLEGLGQTMKKCGNKNKTDERGIGSTQHRQRGQSNVNRVRRIHIEQQIRRRWIPTDGVRHRDGGRNSIGHCGKNDPKPQRGRKRQPRSRKRSSKGSQGIQGHS